MTHENRSYTVVRSRHGWFWASWQDLTSTTDNLRTPTHEGWAASERAAHDAAREALGLGPYVGDLHGPGSNASRCTRGCMGASTGTTLLRYRSHQRGRGYGSGDAFSPARETFVYKVSFHDNWPHGSPSQTFTPHRVMRTSTRYVWVCDQSASMDTWGEGAPGIPAHGPA
jgi:hypothetical protein